MRKLIGFLVYVVVQILFIPFGIIGAVIIYYTQVHVSKNIGVSSTAIEILNGRWTMDKFGLREDPATVKLFSVLPNTSALGQWMALFPLYLLNRIAGEPLLYPTFKKANDATLANLVTTRTVYFDKLLKKSLQQSEQFVVLGAGFDTRCYGDLVNEELVLFELDQKKTQILKRDYLHRAHIATSNVQFVDVDFKTENWYKKLRASGFDGKKVSTFLWEGVTLYLSEEDVRHTLKVIKENLTVGSVIIADFYADKFVSGEMLPGKKKSLDVLELTNEALGFGVVFDDSQSMELQSLIETENLKIGESYYMGSDTKKGTWMAVIEIIV